MITLEAIDSDKAQDHVIIFVGSFKVYLPLIIKGQ